MAEYHNEQDEMEFFERELKKADSFFNTVLRILATAGAILLVILIFFLLFPSCSSLEPASTKSTGIVIEVERDQVWVLFDVVNKNHTDKAANRFYIPGHAYREGDFYPDCTKDPEIPCVNSKAAYHGNR